MQSEIVRAESAQQQVARFTPRQLDLIKTVIAKDASDDELALFIAQFGTTTLAGHQIAGNIGAVLYMTPLSIGVAASTLAVSILVAL